VIFFLEEFGDGGFAGGDTACKADYQHWEGRTTMTECDDVCRGSNSWVSRYFWRGRSAVR
jgi:hypothetical protein